MTRCSRLAALSTLALGLLLTQQAEAQKSGAEVADLIDLGAEYRVRLQHVDPFELSGEEVTTSTWAEQRLRLDLSLKHDVIRIVTQLDVLDGVVFGDNGVFGQDPSPISGVSIATKRPNNTKLAVGLPEGADPLNPDSYVPVLVGADPIEVNLAYGEVLTPVGILRVGRQPLAYGDNLASHEGTRLNRWGVSEFGDIADRFLFATKLSEIYGVLVDGPNHVPDVSQDNGLIMGLFHDWHNTDKIFSAQDDLAQVGLNLQYRARKADWFGLKWQDVRFAGNVVHLSDEKFASDVLSFPLRTDGKVGDLTWSAQVVTINGESREISEGFAALSGRQARVQKIEGLGAFARLDYELSPVTLTMEFDYASGDDDPRPETPITSFSFSRDFNVGLLLFERILAFESARSVGVGIENLSSLNADSFPLTEVQSDGRFNNAIALFPQVKFDLLPQGHDHSLHLRLGVLFAWPEAEGGVVDPILTALAEDGNEITDDAVNFHGGKPGSYYGTEVDAQLQWGIKDRFFWTLEGAFLQPGSSLQDEHGDAVPAFLVESRFTYVY